MFLVDKINVRSCVSPPATTRQTPVGGFIYIFIYLFFYFIFFKIFIGVPLIQTSWLGTWHQRYKVALTLAHRRHHFIFLFFLSFFLAQGRVLPTRSLVLVKFVYFYLFIFIYFLFIYLFFKDKDLFKGPQDFFFPTVYFICPTQNITPGSGLGTGRLSEYTLKHFCSVNAREAFLL